MNRKEMRLVVRDITQRNRIIKQTSALWRETTSPKIVLAFMRRQGFDEKDSLSCLMADSGLVFQEARKQLFMSKIWTEEFWDDELLRNEVYEAAVRSGFHIKQEVGRK